MSSCWLLTIQLKWFLAQKWWNYKFCFFFFSLLICENPFTALAWQPCIAFRTKKRWPLSESVLTSVFPNVRIFASLLSEKIRKLELTSFRVMDFSLFFKSVFKVYQPLSKRMQALMLGRLGCCISELIDRFHSASAAVFSFDQGQKTI